MSLLHCTGALRPLVVTMFNAGQCVVCGCTEEKPCAFHTTRPLWWVDVEHTLCAAPGCFKLWRRIVPITRLHR